MKEKNYRNLLIIDQSKYLTKFNIYSWLKKKRLSKNGIGIIG